LDNVKEKGGLLVGLPRYMEVEIKKDKIIGKSLDPREGGLYGEVKTEVPQGIKWELYPNPLVRRFMVFEITSKS